MQADEPHRQHLTGVSTVHRSRANQAVTPRVRQRHRRCIARHRLPPHMTGTVQRVNDQSVTGVAGQDRLVIARKGVSENLVFRLDDMPRRGHRQVADVGGESLPVRKSTRPRM
jgi:hypothetical protein